MCFTWTENAPSKFSKFIESISYWFARRRKISNFKIYLLVFPPRMEILQHVMELASCVISFTVSPRYSNQWFENGNRLGRKVVLLKSILEHLAHQRAHWAEGRKGWREEIGAEGSSDFTTHPRQLTTQCPHSSQPRCWPFDSTYSQELFFLCNAAGAGCLHDWWGNTLKTYIKLNVPGYSANLDMTEKTRS